MAQRGDVPYAMPQQARLPIRDGVFHPFALWRKEQELTVGVFIRVQAQFRAAHAQGNAIAAGIPGKNIINKRTAARLPAIGKLVIARKVSRNDRREAAFISPNFELQHIAGGIGRAEALIEHQGNIRRTIRAFAIFQQGAGNIAGQIQVAQ